MQPTDLKLFILEWEGDQELHSLALRDLFPPDGYLLAATDGVLELHRSLAGSVRRIVIDEALEREVHESAGTDPEHGAPDRADLLRFLLTHAQRFGLDKYLENPTMPEPQPGSWKHARRYFDTQGHWNEYPGHPVEDWRHEVANDETRLGYREWVLSRIDAGECEPQAAIVRYDFPGLLARLTGRSNWVETTGPDSGVGVDYWYASGGPDGMTAYIHIDQGYASISVEPDASNGDRLIYQGDLQADHPGFVLCNEKPTRPQGPDHGESVHDRGS